MPIARYQFELGIDPDLEEWMRRIHQFLEMHKEEAYSLQELATEFDAPERTFDELIELGKAGKYNEWDAKRRRFLLALQRLVEANVVGERDVAGVKYYATGRYALSDILESKKLP